ncbi:hypothetical protein [Roseimaritima ulvae]|nr:hypothetical protein [Roseimaritima ulvae]
MLARATTSFHFEYGHRPPAASMRSVRMHAWIENKHFNFAKFDLDPLIELDDAERVVFWLGGPAPETDFGFDLRCLYDFEESRLVDRDADGFWEYTSWYGGVYEYDPETKRISSDFSEDASVCRIDPSGIVGESSPAE